MWFVVFACLFATGFAQSSRARICVNSASVSDQDILNDSDAYFEIYYGGTQIGTTSTIENTNSPSWSGDGSCHEVDAAMDGATAEAAQGREEVRVKRVNKRVGSRPPSHARHFDFPVAFRY